MGSLINSGKTVHRKYSTVSMTLSPQSWQTITFTAKSTSESERNFWGGCALSTQVLPRSPHEPSSHVPPGGLNLHLFSRPIAPVFQSGLYWRVRTTLVRLDCRPLLKCGSV